MATCDKELNILPVLATCPTGVEYVLLIGVPSLINGDNLGGYGLITWDNLVGCLNISFPFSVVFKINSSDFPSGDTSYILPFQCFGSENSDIEVVLQNSVMNPTTPDTAGDFTYEVQFNSNNTIITFQINGTPTPPSDDQIMIIRGSRYA